MGVLLTNAYIVYRAIQEEAGVPTHRRLSHYDFLLEIATSWVAANETDIREVKRQSRHKRKSEPPTTGECNSDAETSIGENAQQSTAKKKKERAPQTVTPSQLKKAPRVNDSSLHPQKGSLRMRIDHFNKFHCPQAIKKETTCCQLHRWALGRKNGSHGQTREKLLNCSICEVNLCMDCFKTFHSVESLVEKKEEMQQRFLQEVAK